MNSIKGLNRIEAVADEKLNGKVSMKKLFYIDTFFKVFLVYIVFAGYLLVSVLSLLLLKQNINDYIQDIVDDINRVNIRVVELLSDKVTINIVFTVLVILYILSIVSFKSQKRKKYKCLEEFKVRVRYPRKNYFVFLIFFVLLWIIPFISSISFAMYNYYISYDISYSEYMLIWRIIKLVFVPHMIMGATLIYFFRSDMYYAKRQNKNIGLSFLKVL